MTETESVRASIVAIHQPNFLPWCGFFAKARAADIFVFLDDAQMSAGSYIPRTRVAINKQPNWLSVPTLAKFGTRIDEVAIAPGRWIEKMDRTLSQSYAGASHFADVKKTLWPILMAPPPLLADYNIALIEAVFGFFGWTKTILRSSSLSIQARSDDRLIAIVKELGGSIYLSGKGGVNYQDPAKFAAAGIHLDVREYVPLTYPRGPQSFLPRLSILDALFHAGRDAEAVLAYSA